MSKRPEIGEEAPGFTAMAVGGPYSQATEVRLADFRGRLVVLVFYPKDDTPGCTKQACEIRDGWTEIQDKAAVFGVSIDGLASHEKFIKKHGLPYPLLSDPDQSIAGAYGVWVEKSMYGKKYMGTERTTFVIGGDGRIQGALPKISPGDHLKKLLLLLEAGE